MSASVLTSSSAGHTPLDSNPHAWKRGFWSLFVVQFQGALSDNIFKFLVIFTIQDAVPENQVNQYIAVIAAVFSLPFLLFSMAKRGRVPRKTQTEKQIESWPSCKVIVNLTVAIPGKGSAQEIYAVLFWWHEYRVFLRI